MRSRILVPSFILKKARQGMTRGSFHGSALFADIAGFTPLTERLSRKGKEGAEELAATIRATFDPLVSTVKRHQGFIASFAGDSLLSLFPDDTAATRHAIEAASGILATGRRGARRRIKVGIAFSRLEWFIFPGAPSLWLFRGRAIDRAVSCASSDPRHLSIRYGRPRPPTDEPSGPPVSPRSFLTTAIRSFPELGEFRDVATVFVGSRGPGFIPFVKRLMDLASSRAGYPARVACHDKGNHALVFFGAPEAHERDLERAIRFSLDLEEETTAGSLRVGISHGRLYAGFSGAAARREFTCLGRTTNLAARLMERCRDGEILLAVSPRNLPFVLGRKRSVSLKGFSQPVAARPVTGTKVSVAPRHQTPFVGRSAELAGLLRLATGIRHRGGLAAADISGEAGIGKTRLIHEFSSKLRGFKKLQTSCHPLSQQALDPFRRLLSRSLGAPPSAAELKRRLNEAMGRVPSHLTVAYLASLLDLRSRLPRGVPPKIHEQNMLFALKEWLWRLGKGRPLLLAIEDLQYVDPLTLLAISHLARSPGSPPLLLLCTHRGRLRRKVEWNSRTLKLHLAALDKQESGHLVERTIGRTKAMEIRKAMGSRFAREFGNPLLAEELLAQVKTEGATSISISPAIGRGRSAVARLRPLLQARLDALPSRLRDLVSRAAVLGIDVPFDLLGGMISKSHALKPSVRLAVRAGIFHQEEAGNVTFSHLSLREVAYDSIPPTRLRELHGQAAALLASRRSRSALALRGHHLDRAGRAPEAARCYLRAARLAVKSYAHADAATCYKRYLELAPKESNERMQASFEYARDVLERQYRHKEAEAVYRELLQDGAAINHVGRRRLLFRSGLTKMPMGAFQDAEDALQAALAVEGEPEPTAGAIWNAMGLLRRRQARLRETYQCFQKAIDLARSDKDYRVLGAALLNISDTTLPNLTPEQALSCCLEACRIFRRMGNRWGEAVAAGNLAASYYDVGERHKAVETMTTALPLARRVGHRELEAMILSNLGLIRQANGDDRGHIRYTEQALQIAREAAIPRMEARLLTNFSIAHMRLEEHETGEKLAREAIQAAVRSHSIESRRRAEQALAHALAKQRKWRQARRLYRSLVDGHGRRTSPDMLAFTLLEFCEMERKLNPYNPVIDHLLRRAAPLVSRSTDRDLKITCYVERARVAIARRKNPRKWVKRAEDLNAEQPFPPEGPFGRMLKAIQEGRLDS